MFIYFHYFFQLCYNSGISFKTIIIVYYSFVFGHGLLFTFTIFPKDLTDSTNRDIGNGGSNEEDSISSKTDGNDLKIDTVGQLENENVFTISGEGKENDSDNILIQMYASVGSAINNKTSADWDTSISESTRRTSKCLRTKRRSSVFIR